MIRLAVTFIIFIFINNNILHSQARLPADVKYFPESSGKIADSSFYHNCQPFFSSVNMAADASGKHKNIFILTMGLYESKPVDCPPDCVIKKYPSQAMLLYADTTGVSPRWTLSFEDDSFERNNILGVLRYLPYYNVYTFVINSIERTYGEDLVILDSTFHQIDLIPSSVTNAHDFQLLKSADGKWQIISCHKLHINYLKKIIENYVVEDREYDNDTFSRILWKCSPDIKISDSLEWKNTHENCNKTFFRHSGASDIFHPNSWQLFNWSVDSLLVTVSEKNDDKVRFWWIIDSAGNWVTRNTFQLGCYYDKYNSFSFPDDPHFQISGGHNFRILKREGSTIFASYYDDEECDSTIPARALILSLNPENKTCRILQQFSQGSSASGRGSMQVMLNDPSKASDESILSANSCVAWGGWAKPSATNEKGYFPPGDSLHRHWELSVTNPQSQPIVGITFADMGNYTHHLALNNSDYQAEAWYNLPIPHHPIQYTITGSKVTLITDLVHPIWSTGDTTSSIIVPMPDENNSFKLWVRGKTDNTMIGELWENILLSPDLKKKAKTAKIKQANKL